MQPIIDVTGACRVIVAILVILLVASYCVVQSREINSHKADSDSELPQVLPLSSHHSLSLSLSPVIVIFYTVVLLFTT